MATLVSASPTRHDLDNIDVYGCCVVVGFMLSVAKVALVNNRALEKMVMCMGKMLLFYYIYLIKCFNTIVYIPLLVILCSLLLVVLPLFLVSLSIILLLFIIIIIIIIIIVIIIIIDCETKQPLISQWLLLLLLLYIKQIRLL